MEGIKHGWKPSDPDLQHITKSDARKVSGEDETKKKKKGPFKKRG